MSSISGTPTNVNLNGTTPSAPPDAVNVGFQGGTPYPDPNDPTGETQVRDVTAYLYPPQVGGVIVISDDYQLGGPDSGRTFVCDSATRFNVIMPASPPVLQRGQGVWRVRIVNLGAGAVTLDLNGLTLDITSSSPLSNPILQQGQALDISTDGTNWFSGLKASGFVGGVDHRTTTSETISLSSEQKLVTFSNGSAVAVALDSTLGAAFMCWVVNLGAGTATLTPSAVGSPPSAGTINGAANLALPTGQGCALFFDGTNWYAVTGGGSANFADAEVPSGTIDGSNTSFTLAHTPLATPIIEEDGLMPVKGAASFGYTLTVMALVFTDPPQRSVHVWYRY